MAAVKASWRRDIVSAWADALVQQSRNDGEPHGCYAVQRAMRVAVRASADLGVLRALQAKLRAAGHDEERASLVEYATILCNEGNHWGDRGAEVVAEMVDALWPEMADVSARLRSYALPWRVHRAAAASKPVRHALAEYLRGDLDALRILRVAIGMSTAPEELARALESFKLFENAPVWSLKQTTTIKCTAGGTTRGTSKAPIKYREIRRAGCRPEKM